uniref:CACTA en-spm transposon protein n=1 Tax=Cucumis melo TaxID=3656 RepID=A0A9I9EAD1_CUCME
MDPLRNRINNDASDVVRMAFDISNKKKPLWRIIKCPKQGGIVECRYYVMRFMRDIILSSNRTIIEVIEGSTSTYSQDDLDVVRTVWAEFVNQYILCSQSQSIGVCGREEVVEEYMDHGIDQVHSYISLIRLGRTYITLEMCLPFHHSESNKTETFTLSANGCRSSLVGSLVYFVDLQFVSALHYVNGSKLFILFSHHTFYLVVSRGSQYKNVPDYPTLIRGIIT